MRKILTTLAIAATALTFNAAATAQMAPMNPMAPADDSVYKAFGEKAGIKALMEDFFVRLQADARMAPFFKNANRDRLVEQLTEQLCYEGGGPCVYKGVAMGARHAGMNIGKEDFNALVELLQQSMDAKGIPFRAQNGMLARLAPMNRDIITKN